MEQTLAEKSYDYIRKRLAGGDLPPGKRLVNRVLADEIGVSVIPVREAIHRLASEGLVEHVPGSGSFVRKTDLHDLDNLYVLRDALESCAAGEAARFLPIVSAPEWMSRDGLMVLERDRRDPAVEVAGHGVVLARTARYGSTCLDIYHC